MSALLEVSRLTVVTRDEPSAEVVSDVSFELNRHEALGLAGESGCGKTTTALSLLGLLPAGLQRTTGELRFHGAGGLRRLDRLSPRQLRAVRWASISMIFQGAMNALDPVMPIGDQIGEAIRLHEPELGRTAVAARVRELLDQVHVRTDRAGHYPHEFSGGQRQRLMIALALACRPELVIGDEPTTALDVITQAQILELLGELRRELGLAVLLITHDLSVLAQTCDRIAVMYAGQIVESGPVETVFAAPQHPYTRRLLDMFAADEGTGRLPTPIPGAQPPVGQVPPGCRFAPRCTHTQPRCEAQEPELLAVAGGHDARCHLAPWGGAA